MKILSTISSPQDLKLLSTQDILVLCQEIREYLIEHAAKHGGHFGSSLGAVELTVALHKVFESPKDSIVWDVGHQAYAHKLLTGRQKKFSTIRKKDGIAAFPNPQESPHDMATAGHASVSISSALGMATANTLQHIQNYTIAVIGDGALTGGQAFEALNNAGGSDTNLLIIVNDNQMSIDPNVGGLKNSLLKITKSSPINIWKSKIKNFLQNKSGKFGKYIDTAMSFLNQKIKNTAFSDHNFFESLECQYFGPYNGHDIESVIRKLENIKDIKGPKVLHLLTTKGKGFAHAEKDQTKWHATNGFCLTKKKQNPSSGYKWQDVFGYTLLNLMEKNEKIVGITPAMLSGCGMNIPQKKFFKRIFDTGITEQHAVTFAAGLASKGMTPVCNLYSTFAQRGYDQIIHDVCITSLPVVFCLDRAGLVGEDGETHQGVFDLAFLRPLPNVIIAAPLNAKELENMMYTATEQKKNPFFIRYPKGQTDIQVQSKIPVISPKIIPIGKGRCLQEGEETAIISLGAIGQDVITAVGKISESERGKIAHYDMRFLKPLDTTLLDTIFEKFSKIITVEEGVKKGGFGSAVLEYAQEKKYHGNIKILGIPDRFISQGTIAEQKKTCGIDEQAIRKALQ